MDLARVPPASGQQRAGGRVPQPRRPILAARGEARAVRAEGVSPDAVAVAVANRRLLAGSRVKHRDLPPRRPPARARQPCAVRAHDDGSGLTLGPGLSTRQRTCPASSSKSKAVSSTHAATRRPRRVWATLTLTPAFGADRHGPVLAALQVREAQAGAGQGPDPELVRGGDQEADSPGGQRDHRGAVVEPAAQVPPFPTAQVLRGRVELVRGIGHVVAGQRRTAAAIEAR